MPGHHISDQQVFLFMTHRRQHTQAVAAAKAGISERSARRIENDPQLPSQKKKERHWRTRADPLPASLDGASMHISLTIASSSSSARTRYRAWRCP
jgi:hypothetical protein